MTWETQVLRLDQLRVGSVATVPPAASDTNFRPENLAYVMYTSGSSGNPKAVEITHANLGNLANWPRRAFAVCREARASHLASISFDAAVWEVRPYLCAGAAVYIVDESRAKNPQRLRDWLLQTQITMASAPTRFCEQLLQLPWPDPCSLRYLLTGGDVLSRDPSPTLPFQLVNNYGPTECCVVATSIVLQAAPASITGLPPIGRPIDNVSIHLLDEDKNAVPPGTRGEIWIAGAGVARGYRHRPQLTSKHFQDILVDGTPRRAYRTGDWGRAQPDGNLQFLGRQDQQIKIRGFRVEPFEIECALKTLQPVRDCIVYAEGDLASDKSLVAGIEHEQGGVCNENEVRQQLASAVPEYMIPAQIVFFPELPRSSSGKVDRGLFARMFCERLLSENTHHASPGPNPQKRILA